MGKGLSFVCKNCGHKYDIHLGSGFFFTEVYESSIKKIKAGKYGKEWKELIKSQAYIAVDAEDYLYICNSCGNWKVLQNLSLYAPKKPEEIAYKKYGEQTVEQLGYVPYVMRHQLKSDYQLLKSYPHNCPKCKKIMSEYSDNDLDHITTLQCPKCKTENEVSGLFFWD
ncbi:MAG: hypothetical protein J1F11_08060 [Oscillospiraceae bacterium]|nr:hypothetical protein [Oscillospiraceae bacterium]